MTGAEIRVFKGHFQPVWSLAFSRNGLLASASTDATGKGLGRGHGPAPPYPWTQRHRGGLQSGRPRPGHRGRDATVRIWDPITGKELLVFRKTPTGGGPVSPLAPDASAWCRGQATLVAPGESSSGMPHGPEDLAFRKHGGGVMSVAFHSDGERLPRPAPAATPLPARWTGRLKVWNARTGEEAFTCPAKWGAPGAWPSPRRPASRLSQQRRIGELP